MNQVQESPWSDGHLYPADLPDLLRLQLYNTERASVHNPNEVVSIFQIDGTLLLQKMGGPRSVSVNRAERLLLVGAVVTHNHPLVATPSIDDFLMAFDYRVLEMRAVDPHWIYRLRSREGWPIYKRAFLIPLLAPNLAIARLLGIADVQERNHEAWTRTAGALGLDYRRIHWVPPAPPV